MKKTAYLRLTTNRIMSAAPDLKFVAIYHREEERLNASMMGYGDRSFVYILVTVLDGEEHFLYVGKSKSQYTRCLTHSRRIEYTHMYLFESSPEQLSQNERLVIQELVPFLNRAANPEADRYRKLLNIDYDGVYDAEKIQDMIQRYKRYQNIGLFGFAIPVALFAALETEASASNCTCSEMIQLILEREFLSDGKVKLDVVSDMTTNLVTTNEYGRSHDKSPEQIKQYLHQKTRLPGTAKVGRDWVIPRDVKFPDDRRSVGEPNLKTSKRKDDATRDPEACNGQ